MRLVGAVLACGLCLCAGTAAAQSYDEAVARGVQEFSAGNWEEACVNFGLAHQLRPGPRPLRGKGMCLYEQKRYAEAVEALQQALSLEDTDFPLTAEMADSARTLLDAALKYVVKLSVSVQPSGATLTLDGRPAVAGTLYVNRGAHELVATHGGRRLVRNVEVRLGEQLQLALQVPGPEGGAPADVASDAGLTAEVPEGSMGVAPVVAFVAGGAGLLTMGVFGALALSEHSRLAGECEPTCTDGEVSTLQGYTTVADIGLGVGLVGTALGLWLWQMDSADAGETAVVPMLGPDSVGLVARGAL